MTARKPSRLSPLEPHQCMICHKTFPSPEAGSAHLDKRHNGEGYLLYWKVAAAAALKKGKP